MKVLVNEQTQKFYLFFENKWVPMVGHEIKVGDYRFSAVVSSDEITVSEVTSGFKLFSDQLDFATTMLTQTKEDAMIYLKDIIGPTIKSIIEERKDFHQILEQVRQKAFDCLGEMPPIEDVDTDWMFEEISDVLN